MAIETRQTNGWAQAADRIPTGTILGFAGETPPAGWLLCNGQQVSRLFYQDLFAEIGDAWGPGDGATTFEVPDLCGAFVRGSSTHGGNHQLLDVPAYVGPDVGSFGEDAIQGHKHGREDPGHNHSIRYYSEWAQGGTRRGTFHGSATSGSQISKAFTGITVQQPTLGMHGVPRVGPESRPFAAGINFIIRT